MNERTFKWELTQGLVLELVSLDKEARRDFFKNLPIENVPMGSLMDTSKVEVDDKGQVTFAVTPQEVDYNPLGNLNGGLAETRLAS